MARIPSAAGMTCSDRWHGDWTWRHALSAQSPLHWPHVPHHWPLASKTSYQQTLWTALLSWWGRWSDRIQWYLHNKQLRTSQGRKYHQLCHCKTATAIYKNKNYPSIPNTYTPTHTQTHTQTHTYIPTHTHTTHTNTHIPTQAHTYMHAHLVRRILFCLTKPYMMPSTHFGWTLPSKPSSMWSFQTNLRQGGGKGPGLDLICACRGSVMS